MERYREIIPGWDAFWEALHRPQPLTARVNRLKAEPAAVRRRLASLGFTVTPAPWDDGVFELTGPYPASRTVEHWLGLIYIQETAAMWPARALGARPGERVLDLCASPGGKTGQLAEAMENRGLLVANDVSARRLRSLHSNLARLGVLNAAVTQHDGLQYPLGAGPFDRVLVDAPCTAEGNARREPRLRRGAPLREVSALRRRQTRLLLRALALVRPGGVVVYSTCTFAPEENEGTISDALRAARQQGLEAAVEPLELPVPSEPGLTRFGDEEFLPELAGARRIYPHHLNSGGMFCARLRRAP